MSQARYYTAQQVGELAVDIMIKRVHLPLFAGHANRDKIEDAITIGLYSKALLPMTQGDVDFVIETVDRLLEEASHV